MSDIIVRPGERLTLVVTTSGTAGEAVRIHFVTERDLESETGTPMPLPGRAGYSRDQLAWLAEQYRQAELDDPRAPVHLLARRIGRHPVTTGRMLTRARKEGLLTDSEL